MTEEDRKKWEEVNKNLILLRGYIENASEALWKIWKIVDTKLDNALTLDKET